MGMHCTNIIKKIFSIFTHINNNNSRNNNNHINSNIVDNDFNSPSSKFLFSTCFMSNDSKLLNFAEWVATNSHTGDNEIYT
jgi:hypothetical protein